MRAAVPPTSDAVNPRADARRRVGDAYDARVLEPSPPAVTAAPWFADDPVQDGATGGPVLAPVPGLGATWDELAAADPSLAPWCADRWLGAWRRLDVPTDLDVLDGTRRSWHALAEHVVAPARHRVNGKIGLRYTRGGFGTPFFGADEQVRVDAADLVVVRGDDVRRAPITTVRAAALAVGVEPGAPTEVYAPTTPLEPDAALVVDSDAAALLGDWFGFGTSVLEELRAGTPSSAGPARVQVWPEHFDASVDFGNEEQGRRATYGACPGDDAHPLPYIYVTPWTNQSGSFWNEGSYASLGLADFVAAADQRRAALDFFAAATALLAATP
jgi:hypothetical protein